MTWVYKEYEVKMKVLQEQWLLLKKKFYQVIKWKLLFSGIEWTFGGGESTGVGKFLEQAGNVSKFWASRGTPPPTIPSVGETLFSIPSVEETLLITIFFRFCSMTQQQIQLHFPHLYVL